MHILFKPKWHYVYRNFWFQSGLFRYFQVFLIFFSIFFNFFLKIFNKPIHPPALAQAQTHRISTTFFFDPGVTPFLALMYLDMLN